MRIVALLSWYDEPPAMLHDSMVSLAPHIDHLVALDGAYSYYPDGRTESDPDQYDAIRAGLRQGGCHSWSFYMGVQMWRDEIAKRTELFRASEEHSAPTDWYVIWDADMVMLDAEDLRDSLARARETSAMFMLRSSEASNEEQWIRHRMAHRAIRGLSVVGRHSVYGYLSSGRWQYVWGHPDAPPALDLTDSVMVWHDPGRRSPDRLAASRECNAAGGRYEDAL